MEEDFDVDVLRVARALDIDAPADDLAEVVLGIVIGSELTDGREQLVAAGVPAVATVFIDDLLEGIGVVHVVAGASASSVASKQLDRAVASAVVAWFAVLATPVRAVAIDGRVILPADPTLGVEGVGMVTGSFPTEPSTVAELPVDERDEGGERDQHPEPVSLAEAAPL